MGYETNLPQLNWNTIASLVLMVIASVSILVWAVYDLRGGGAADTGDDHDPSGKKFVSKLSVAKNVPAARDGVSRQTRHIFSAGKSDLSMILQSNPKVHAGNTTIEEIEVENPGSSGSQTHHRPYVPSLPLAISRPQHTLRPLSGMADKYGPKAQLPVGTRISNQRKAVPGLPHPRLNPIMPVKRSMYKGPSGKSAGQKGYDEERDDILLRDMQPFQHED